MTGLTPMIKQYLDIKENYKDSILLFRLGDFYETFFEDAKIISEVLQIVLTNRNGHPMAGIPYHALDNYLKKILDNGYKVAICEQMEDPSQAKGIVRREVTRIITPGTIIEDNMLDEYNKFSCLIDKKDDKYIIAIFDFSTGEIYLDSLDLNENELIDFIINYGFVQVLISFRVENINKKIKEISNRLYTEKLDEWYFSSDYKNHIKESYDMLSIDHLEYTKDELKVLDAVLKYLEITQFQKIKHFKIPKRLKNLEYMFLDSTTIYNLGIVPSPDIKGKTLYDVLKYTKTPMGNRKLSDILIRPLKDRKKIERRLNIVESLKNDEILIRELDEYLSSIRDIERISSRIALQKATPKDIAALRDSLSIIPFIDDLLKTNEILKDYFLNVDLLQDLKDMIEKTIFDEPSLEIGKGEVIKQGISEELDEYRNLTKDIDKYLKEIENKEKSKTGLTSLKIGRNKVYGFYIEISKAQAKNAPIEYTRKQTLTNSERFITKELNELEKKLIISEEKIKKIEKEIFEKFISNISRYVKKIKHLSEKIADVDYFKSFAIASKKYNYVRPIFSDEKTHIKSGRHPIVENFVSEFTSNDFSLDSEKTFIVLTGPNMSGKSTYLRQMGLISIMAQSGCFVPADYAELKIHDRVFTRIGAKDDIITGKSTFLMEMMEMSTILNQATEKSLVLLDEVGRGTSTLDGISVAWAISEYIFQVLKSTTIFATHYTELTLLCDIYPEVITKRVKVMETNNGVVFLHKIEDGVSDNSYGIEVARLAGFPSEIVERSKEVLGKLTDKVDIENKIKRMRNISKKKYKRPEGQLKMF
ncbi:DNA mismatch repair protein MutS [Oceanotoga teriensis]|jgi:DNA mismatch repair protein MutS|uniref:DNA mismatch repair protein MutS n=1 Tax=Oceanotoga teriensis TaxID=515440 RepID=UPI0027130EF4|nr:DNA mismatch repair protein MutS [Oceanotoga teriensis]MDO7976674.1 DNA mismatch repair protein MutS [Oceanotoga teriensis]